MTSKIFCTLDQLAFADRCTSTMNDILGVDIREHSRSHLVVWGRFIVASILRDHGWTNVSIGYYFGYDRTTVTHWLKSIDTMKTTPSYGIERELFNKLNKQLL